MFSTTADLPYRFNSIAFDMSNIVSEIQYILLGCIFVSPIKKEKANPIIKFIYLFKENALTLKHPTPSINQFV